MENPLQSKSIVKLTTTGLPGDNAGRALFVGKIIMNIQEAINRNMQNGIAAQQEFAMFQLSLEAALKTNPEMWETYLWHKTMYQSKHLELARTAMTKSRQPNLEALNQLTKHIAIIKKQADDEGFTEAFEAGVQEVRDNEERRKAKKVVGKLTSNTGGDNGKGHKIIPG